MGRPHIHDDDTFSRAYLVAPSLTQLAHTLGMSVSGCSVRAKRLRQKGADLPSFNRSADELPTVLQVQRWEWVIGIGQRVLHRRALGEHAALCGSATSYPRAVAFNSERRKCRRCWPVKEHPFTAGRVPPPAEDQPSQVVVERRYGQCIFLRLDIPGKQWVDLETDETHSGGVAARRWWPLVRENSK